MLHQLPVNFLKIFIKSMLYAIKQTSNNEIPRCGTTFFS